MGPLEASNPITIGSEIYNVAEAQQKHKTKDLK